MKTAAELEALVKKHGSLTKAADASGVGRTTFRKMFHRAKAKMHAAKGVIRQPKPANPVKVKPAEPATLDQDDSKGIATATSFTADIHTVAQLLAAVQVDTKVWEVERKLITKDEVVMREPATTVGGAGADAVISTGKHGEKSTLWTRASNQPIHVPVCRIKIWLKRKTPVVLGTQSLVERMEAAAPLLPIIKLRKRKLPHRRSLEICIMDPHIGLLCQSPEADSPQDIDSAAGVIMASIDDLVEKAMPFGPFEEAFMPFGNDFTHIDNLEGATSAGTNQPEAIAWHHVFDRAEAIAIEMVEKVRKVAKKLYIYQIPGNHSRITDFALARVLRAHFRHDPNIIVDASASPYKFHRFGTTLIGYDHGHSVSAIRLAALMANERGADYAATSYREWHLADQHRKGSSKPAAFEEQGVSVEYIPGLTAPNEWHRLKAFNHQKAGAMAWVYDFTTGPIGRYQHNLNKFAKTLQ